MIAKLKNLLQYEPAVLAWAVNGGLAAILAFLVHLSPDQVADVTIVTTGLSTIYTAVMTRPVSVSVLIGALVTIAPALGAFGLHLSTDAIGVGVTVLSAILGLVFRANLTPTARLRANAIRTDRPVAGPLRN